MDIALRCLEAQGVESLLLAARAQGCDRERLRLPPGKEGRAVRAGGNPDFACDGTDLVRSTPIWPSLLHRDAAPDNVLLELVERELNSRATLRRDRLLSLADGVLREHGFLYRLRLLL